MLYFFPALGVHVSGWGPAASRECPGLSVVGESREGEALVLRGELMADDGGGANRGTYTQ